MQLEVLEFIQDMPLSEENQEWVLAKINEAIHPNGFKRFANFLRYWGLLSIVITGVLTLIGIAVTLGIFATNKTTIESEFRGRTSEKLEQIEGTLKVLSASIEGLRIRQISATPTDLHSIKEAKNLINSARLNQVQINREAIVDAGKRFITVANRSPDAWDAVLEFLQYRTFQNSVTVKLGPQVPSTKDIEVRYQLPFTNVPQGMHLEMVNMVHLPDAAQLRLLSNHSLNENLPISPEFLIVTAPIVILDGVYARKVAFTNTHIVYKGGALSLNEVYFLNCTFEIQRDLAGQTLAKAILSPHDATNYTTEKAS